MKAQDDAPLVLKELAAQDWQAPTDAPPALGLNLPATQLTQEAGGIL